jgi:DeoR/GlpR family transcriptional regulator of sugar metabolism
MRVERIEQVFEFIHRNQPANISRIMANFPQISRQTLQDYVRVLESSKRIKRNQVGAFLTSSNTIPNTTK